MHRSRIFGYVLLITSLSLCLLFFYFAFYKQSLYSYNSVAINNDSYFAISIPIGFVALSFLGAGFWIGWTILTIKVAPPMPEIVEKKDYAKIKAFLLCLITLALAGLFIYGVILRNYWALAIPAAAITIVILGMIFWVGIAIITTRSTLPKNKRD